MALERVVEKLKDKGVIQTEIKEGDWPFECLNDCGGTGQGYTMTISRIGGFEISRTKLKVIKILYKPENKQRVEECNHRWEAMGLI